MNYLNIHMKTGKIFILLNKRKITTFFLRIGRKLLILAIAFFLFAETLSLLQTYFLSK